MDFRACGLAEAAAASLSCVREVGPEVDRFELAAVAGGARGPALGDGGRPRAVRIGRGLIGATDAKSDGVAVTVSDTRSRPCRRAFRKGGRASFQKSTMATCVVQNTQAGQLCRGKQEDGFAAGAQKGRRQLEQADACMRARVWDDARGDSCARLMSMGYRIPRRSLF